MDKEKIKGGPFISIAAFCERTSRADDGSISLHNVLREIIVEVPGATRDKPTLPIPVGISIDVVLAVHAGNKHGVSRLEMWGTRDDGTDLKVGECEITWTDEQRAFEAVWHLNLTFHRAGWHWFSVHFDGRVLTRLPLNVIPVTALDDLTSRHKTH